MRFYIIFAFLIILSNAIIINLPAKKFIVLTRNQICNNKLFLTLDITANGTITYLMTNFTICNATSFNPFQIWNHYYKQFSQFNITSYHNRINSNLGNNLLCSVILNEADNFVNVDINEKFYCFGGYNLADNILLLLILIVLCCFCAAYCKGRNQNPTI